MTWEVSISNVAGIRSGTATIQPGINAIRGTNWQGKSSFVTAVETAMGTEAVLTEGETEGRVELTGDDEAVAVELVRENGTIQRRGTPLLTDEQTRVAASLYTFLDDGNDVRQAVRNGENLEAVLTRPLDFENIDEQIRSRSRERDQVERELERAREAAEQLSAAQETVHDLENELSELEERRAELATRRDAESDAGTHREALSDAKAERDSVESQIERLERSIDRTRDTLQDRRDELDDLAIPEVDEDLSAKIDDARERYREFERNAELLQSIYAPTRRLLDEERLDLVTEVERDLVADTLNCWTCGHETTRDEISDRLERLSDRISELRSKAADQEGRVDELRDRQREYERATRRQAELESEIDELEAKVDEREGSLERSRERLADLEARIEDLSETVKQTDDELTDLESQIKYTEAQLEDAEEELDSLQSRADQRESLQEQHDALTEEIRSLRNRKDETKRRTREAFDDAIQDVLSRFDVGFEMVRLTANFELVVAREGRESSLDALSEGELELLGIVACLAGYEAFDVTDGVPIMLLDGLGGLADDNLRTLVEYLSERVEYLVFTTYPENTRFEGNTIDPTEWSVVSPDSDVVEARTG